MQSTPATIVVLGTGGTIAGTAASASDALGYQAAQLGIRDLVAAVPALSDVVLDAFQVAQLDSKDMDEATWCALATTVAAHLARPEVQGIVVTHGTDTLEETAYLLQRLLAPAKPVVLVAAMRPATALQADGPQNLLDAVVVARSAGAKGVVAVMAGRVFGSLDVRKVHPYRLDAFEAGDAGAIAEVENGVLRRHRDWPAGEPLGLDRLPEAGGAWPWVEIVTSHAGARAAGVRALGAAGVAGLVVAATGNGTVHRALEAALADAEAAGVRVVRSTRCLNGSVLDAATTRWPSAGALTPVQARIALMLSLMTT